MKARSKTLAFALLVMTLNLAIRGTAQTPPATPAQRLTHLRRGINLSEWFAQVWDPKGYTKEHLQTWTTADDVVLIQKMGFDHVRLSVNPAPMFRKGHANEIPADYLGYLDAAVKMILDHGLAVVIDIHPESDFKTRLAHEDDFVENFADFWRAFAKHYSTLDPDRVFFEILNEPEMSDRYRWYGVETKLANAIREGAPQHTIIAAGARWSDDDDLLFLEPLRDPNVIYNFHFYDPHIFTHQSSTWAVSFWHYVHGLSYPSNPASAAAAAANVPEATDRLQVIRYGMDHWDATRIETEVTQVEHWARQRGLAITCNEFGVYRKADPGDRTRWLTDVRTTFEKHNMGWAMWDYSGGFGVVTKQDGKTVVDEGTVKALGLKMP